MIDGDMPDEHSLAKSSAFGRHVRTIEIGACLGSSLNSKGLDFYDRLLDELVANGIAPFPTRMLRRCHGFPIRRDPAALAASPSGKAHYAGFVAEKLSDRARHFFTLNECWTFVELGHATGVFAPGLKLPPDRLNQLRHHVLLAHGLAVRAIRARSPTGTQIGPAENVSVCVPVVETPEHIAAAELATRELNAPYLTAMMEGRSRESSWWLPAWTLQRSPPGTWA